jgi:hypothetical protein
VLFATPPQLHKPELAPNMAANFCYVCYSTELSNRDGVLVCDACGTQAQVGRTEPPRAGAVPLSSSLAAQLAAGQPPTARPAITIC